MITLGYIKIAYGMRQIIELNEGSATGREWILTRRLWWTRAVLRLVGRVAVLRPLVSWIWTHHKVWEYQRPSLTAHCPSWFEAIGGGEGSDPQLPQMPEADAVEEIEPFKPSIPPSWDDLKTEGEQR